MKRTYLTGIFFLLILIPTVFAVGIFPQYNWPIQKIIFLNEDVFIGKEKSKIQLISEISIGPINNYTDWIGFNFEPTDNFRFQSVTNFEENITNIDGEKINYQRIYDLNYSRYYFNISLNKSQEWNLIRFNVNYDLSNLVTKTDDASYALSYHEDSEVLNEKNKAVGFIFPNNLKITYNSIGERLGENEIVLRGQDTKKGLILFDDKNELLWIDFRKNLMWIFFGAGVSILAGLGLDYLRKKVYLDGKIKEYKKHKTVEIKIKK